MKNNDALDLDEQSKDVNNDKYLIVEWISLVFAYGGYFLGRLINNDLIIYLTSGIVGLILVLFFFFKKKPRYNYLYPLILAFISGLACSLFKEFSFDQMTIAIMIGYGLLALIINFVFKIVGNIGVYIIGFCIIFLIALGVFNIIDYSIYGKLNLIMVMFFTPILSSELIYKVKKGDLWNHLITGYFISFILLLFFSILGTI